MVTVEDVFMTGIVRKAANLTLSNSIRFPSWLTRTPTSECRFLAGELVGLHGYEPKKMLELWERWQQSDTLECE